VIHENINGGAGEISCGNTRTTYSQVNETQDAFLLP
jgi:hypothetical protein